MPKKETFAFGKSFDRLTEIVESLEGGEVDLDKALEQYEEGLKLVQACNKKLKEVGNKIEVIKDKYE
jgi:exodeoxyribonuclease VII small subunit